MALYLAVDSGGTKADYVLADGETVLARVRGGCMKLLRVDEATAAANLSAALADLSRRSGVMLSDVDRTCIGTAGNTVPLIQQWLRREFARRVGGALTVMGDVDIALDAAFQGGPGVLVLAGTGSNVAGRGTDGAVKTVGGWGPALSDQGSGHRIGSEALRAAFLARDEGLDTSLMQKILQHWQLSSEDTLIEHANRTPPPDFSRLTALILQCALEGDPVATGVLRQQGEELGYLVRLILRKLTSSAGPAAAPFKLAFAGSIMENLAPVRSALIDFVRQDFPRIEAFEGVVDPIAGALWRARMEGADSAPDSGIRG